MFRLGKKFFVEGPPPHPPSKGKKFWHQIWLDTCSDWKKIFVEGPPPPTPPVKGKIFDTRFGLIHVQIGKFFFLSRDPSPPPRNSKKLLWLRGGRYASCVHAGGLSCYRNKLVVLESSAKKVSLVEISKSQSESQGVNTSLSFPLSSGKTIHTVQFFVNSIQIFRKSRFDESSDLPAVPSLKSMFAEKPRFWVDPSETNLRYMTLLELETGSGSRSPHRRPIKYASVVPPLRT